MNVAKYVTSSQIVQQAKAVIQLKNACLHVSQRPPAARPFPRRGVEKGFHWTRAKHATDIEIYIFRGFKCLALVIVFTLIGCGIIASGTNGDNCRDFSIISVDQCFTLEFAVQRSHCSVQQSEVL